MPTGTCELAARCGSSAGQMRRWNHYAHLFVEQVRIRRARTADVPVIRRLVDMHAGDGPRMLRKSTVTLYEDVQEFWVAEDDSAAILGCGALHVMWEDLAEVRTVAVDPGYRGRGVGHHVVRRLLENARELGVRRVFCLTFEVEFFARHGFRPILGAPVSHEVYEELLRSYDEGVAEFLELDRVKPNTLGNTRMLLRLEDAQ
jgi:amino-acid N-acetyltransferase